MIDLPTIQKKLNLHYTLSLDLFGSEVSTNAANAFNSGLKGRYRETQIEDDHRLQNDTYPVLKLVDGEIRRVDEPALTALNMRLRDDYTQDCVKGMLRWNKIITLAGYDYKLALPQRRVPPPDRRVQGRARDARRRADRRRDLGEAQERLAAVDRGRRLHREPDEVRDRARQVRAWISPPKVGIDNKPGDFEYVKIETLMPPAAKAEKPARAENTALLRDIGARVRNERAKRGMTRKTLAQQCQTSERYLAQIELGEANPSVLVLDAIARALDLDPVDLMPPGRTREAPGGRAREPRAPHRADRAARRRQVDARRGTRRTARLPVRRDRQDDRARARRAGRDAVRGLRPGYVPPLRARLPDAHRRGARGRRDRDRRRDRGGRRRPSAQLLDRDPRHLAAGLARRAHAPRDGAGRLPPDGGQSQRDERSRRDPRGACPSYGRSHARLDTSGKSPDACVAELATLAERLFSAVP